MTTVFHRSELLMQAESGVEERIHKVGNMLIRDHIIDQHKEFFEGLSYVFVALHDADGQPWLSLMQGIPGFIQSPDNKTLNLNGKVIAADELGLQTQQGTPIGIVGLDLSRRRRNRLNGYINNNQQEGFLSIAVDHSFGNCPKYIQLRNFESTFDTKRANEGIKTSAEHFVDFSDLDTALIRKSDTLFIASSEKKGGNLDANHRGGKPGFVRVDDTKQLWFNDYPGNNFFQTFGNVHNHPSVGLTFLDFESGDLLFLSGKARLEKGELPKGIKTKRNSFLPRQFHFTLERGIRIKSAVCGHWSFEEMSPFLKNDLD